MNLMFIAFAGMFSALVVAAIMGGIGRRPPK